VFKGDRAPPFERPVPRTPHEACSSQVLPRHTRGAPYRCSLPGLAGFDASRCVGPNLRRRLMRLTRHDTPSGGDSTPLERIAGYRAPLPPRLARPHRDLSVKNHVIGGGGGIRTRGTVARARHFQCRTFGRSVTPPHQGAGHSSLLEKCLAEGRGFEPPRDLRPYPISSRTPSTGLGHPSANSLGLTSRYRRVSKNTLSSRAASSASTPPVVVAR
jgi:hypothetical protein